MIFAVANQVVRTVGGFVKFDETWRPEGCSNVVEGVSIGTASDPRPLGDLRSPHPTRRSVFEGAQKCA